MIILREYQEKAVTSVRDEVKKGKRKIIMVLPTGAGKTYVMADIALRCIDNGHKVLALMHRRLLVYQMRDRFSDYGIDVGIIMSGVETNFECSVQIGTIQTYHKRLQLSDVGPETNIFFTDAAVILIDEAHRSLSRTYKEVFANYTDKIIIGVTATPCLASGMGMGNFYDALVDIVDVQELIDQKHLVPVRYYAPSKPDLKEIKTILGDYDKKELGKRMNKQKLIGDIYLNWAKLAGGKQTIVFAVNVKHSIALKDEFVRYGVNAEHFDAHSSDEIREDILRRLESGDIQVICNVGLLTEGFDYPGVECIVVARPTKSMGLYRQMLGRGLRPSEGKKEIIIIDHGGCIDRLGFIEDDIEWSLDGKRIAFKKKVIRKKEKTIITCPECMNVFIGNVCTRCGFKIKNWGKMIETTDTELVEVGKNRKKYTMQEKLRFMQMAEYHRRLKGYAKGWAAHFFRSKFLVWPNRFKDVSPLKPDQSFRNYLTYRNIKYAKSKRNVIGA